MAITKTARTIVAASTSNSAGSSTTGTAVDLTSAHGMLITTKVTNGVSAPGVGCLVQVLVSVDNTNYKVFQEARAGLATSTDYEFSFLVPRETMYANVKFSENTTNAVTVEAFGHELSAV